MLEPTCTRGGHRSLTIYASLSANRLLRGPARSARRALARAPRRASSRIGWNRHLGSRWPPRPQDRLGGGGGRERQVREQGRFPCLQCYPKQSYAQGHARFLVGSARPPPSNTPARWQCPRPLPGRLLISRIPPLSPWDPSLFSRLRALQHCSGPAPAASCLFLFLRRDNCAQRDDCAQGVKTFPPRRPLR